MRAVVCQGANMNQKSNLPILLTVAVAFLSLRTKRAVAMELMMEQL